MQFCEHLTVVGLEEGERRRNELEGFHRCHREACTSSQQNSVERISEYEHLRKKVCVHC